MPWPRWDFSAPPPSKLNDHEVSVQGTHLAGKRIALLITGSIAAYRTPDLVRELRREGAEVVVFASPEALRYVAREALEWTSLHRVVDSFTADAEHLSDSAPFAAYLVAPATYNILNKMALGIADSVVSATLASALGKLERGSTQVLVAPAMHGSMHNSILIESLHKLEKMGVKIITPRQENGKDNLPSHTHLVGATIASLSTSPLQGKDLLITGGPTPVPLDQIRRITTKFTGALAIQIAQEAYFRGAWPHLLLGAGAWAPPEFLPCTWAQTYDEYLAHTERLLSEQPICAGIFSAAVADYRPAEVYAGKIPSGSAERFIQLVPTQKVIARVRQQFPALTMVTFKYEENLTHQALMAIAQKRLEEGFQIVVANRGEERGAHGEQVAWIAETGEPPERTQGKAGIASAILDRLEKRCAALV